MSSVAAYPAVVANELHLFRIVCSGCAAEWAGEDRAHCAGCHVSFDSVVLFDVHREGGGCLRPQVLGLVATKNGIWREQASTRPPPPIPPAKGRSPRREPRPEALGRVGHGPLLPCDHEGAWAAMARA